MKRALFSAFALAVSVSVCGVTAKRDNLASGKKSITDRIAGREFPSVFQAWGRADNLKGESPLAVMARHDLVWCGPTRLGLVWDENPSGLAEAFTPGSIKKARQRRKALLELDPNLILIAEIRYRDAPIGFLPRDHEWWARWSFLRSEEAWPPENLQRGTNSAVWTATFSSGKRRNDLPMRRIAEQTDRRNQLELLIFRRERRKLWWE